MKRNQLAQANVVMSVIGIIAIGSLFIPMREGHLLTDRFQVAIDLLSIAVGMYFLSFLFNQVTRQQKIDSVFYRNPKMPMYIATVLIVALVNAHIHIPGLEIGSTEIILVTGFFIGVCSKWNLFEMLGKSVSGFLRGRV